MGTNLALSSRGCVCFTVVVFCLSADDCFGLLCWPMSMYLWCSLFSSCAVIQQMQPLTNLQFLLAVVHFWNALLDYGNRGESKMHEFTHFLQRVSLFSFDGIEIVSNGLATIYMFNFFTRSFTLSFLIDLMNETKNTMPISKLFFFFVFFTALY